MLSLSQAAPKLLEESGNKVGLAIGQAGSNPGPNDISNVETAEDSSGFRLDEKVKQKILLLERFIESLTGKRIKLSFLDEKELDDLMKQKHTPNLLLGQRIPNNVPGGSQPQGWGLVYNLYQEYSEQEKTSFQAAGVVTTADGKEIKFEVSINLGRYFKTQTDLNIRAGDALKDPLVINFGAASASVSETKMKFDIDADGTPEQISQLNPGTGFFVLDRNNDNIVNDGRELFGAMSGNGFSELAGYDQDQNGWIDENDMIYDKLRVWVQDSSGKSQLFSLSQADVGAIYLGNTETPFSLKDSQNQLLGQLRSSGIYLSDDGTIKTIQQIDL